MKKSLLAVAAIGAFASAAQAQSSVTVYGILDVGYVGGNAKASTVNATGGQITPAENVSLFGQSAQTTSRLGFKGTEDLGGGLSALFTFETGLQPQQTSLSSFNNRQAFVGLAKKGAGNARIGTQYTPIHEAVGATGANQQNNLVGDVIYPQNTGLTNRDGSASNANAGYTVRSNNMLRFESESFAGFTGKAFMVQNARNENQTSYATNSTSTATAAYTSGLGYVGGNTNSNGWGLGVNYTWQKLLVSANYQSFTTENAWNQQTNQVAVGVAGTTPVTRTQAAQTGILTNMKDNQVYAGATYDFGILKAYAQYVNRKETSGLDSNAYAKRSAQQIGVRSFVTPTVEVWASGGMGRYTAFGYANPTTDFTGYQLGANYWLSKRTNLYTIFGATNTSQSSGQVVLSNGTTSMARSFSANANNYAVGVRHTF
ncbi:porin [Polynucleobacter sp. es-MAR-4]|uniref:porin n=1 Tax=Polynucleobacter sp. es-MAR-4 TaxID=1855655 RepID=UPI001C0D6E28|nr:porin [Polynucleobacter sp. es-MAR-4]MBU3637776.1 porin [Polynucleobacter sp. es-MAR-4]